MTDDPLPPVEADGYTRGVHLQDGATESEARRIGKYEVLGELGHGGMAVVYRARDTQLLRDVAVKVLHPHLANDPESRQRFLREAQAAARLRHPNIVEVFDFSVEADRESFMVSELLEGPTLRRFAEQHPGMPAEITAAIGVLLCDALACAHAQGVIHRDVKPDNILLEKGGSLKLTDFGIAHVADGGGMTVTGQVLGSPAHMAPEQIEGRRIDARADLFAAGTVLYALAVGRLPFEASHPHALLRKILESEYPDPLRVAPGVGHRLAAIICKCLEREPDRRYTNAKELGAALLAFIAEVGWTDAATPLKAYFLDPEGFTAIHRTALLERLPALGVEARRDGRTTDALGYFNRALAIDPANTRVLILVRGISRRRRIRRAIAAVSVVCGAAVLSAVAIVGGTRIWRAHDGPVARARPWVSPDPNVFERFAAEMHPREGRPIDPATPVVPFPVVEPNAPVPVVAAATRRGGLRPVAAHPAGPPAPAQVEPSTRFVHIRVRDRVRNVDIYVDNVRCGGAFCDGPLTLGVHHVRLDSADMACGPSSEPITVIADPSGENLQQTVLVRAPHCPTGPTPPDSSALIP